MATDTKKEQAKAQEAKQSQAQDREKKQDVSKKQAQEKVDGASGSKRKAQDKDVKDKDNKDKNKRNRPDKPVAAQDIRFRLLCYESQAGAVIGKGGDTVRNIRRNTGAEVSVLPPTTGNRLRIIVIESSAGFITQSRCPAREALLHCATLIVEGDQPLSAPDPSQLIEVRLLVPSALAAGLMGVKRAPGSVTIGEIMARCGSSIVVPPASEWPKFIDKGEEFLLLRGPWPTVYSALGMIADEARRSFFDPSTPAVPMVSAAAAAAGAPYGFVGGGPMGPAPGATGPFGPMVGAAAMQQQLGAMQQLGMEMAAVAAGAGLAMGMGMGGGMAPQGGGGVGGVFMSDGGGGMGGGGGIGDGGLGAAGLVPEFRTPAEAATPITVTYRLAVPENKAGRFIGKGGEALHEVRKALNLTTLKVHPVVKDTAVRVLEAASTDPASSRCAAAEALLLYVDRLASSQGARQRVTLRMLVPHGSSGAIVGPRGAIIRQVSLLTQTSCVVHKKSEVPAYGGPDDQELEAEGEARNLVEAFRMITALIRGYEFRQKGITVRETICSPEFAARRAAMEAGGGGPNGPVGPMGPPISMNDVVIDGPPISPRQPHPHGPMDPMQSANQQQLDMMHGGGGMGMGSMGGMREGGGGGHRDGPLGVRQQGGGGPGMGHPAAGGAASGGVACGLPPLGPNEVRLSIFVAAALVNAPEGINGTNVQQVQAVTETSITLRQPVTGGHYELDITGTLSQVMQAHSLLSNIMTIGAILQQKPQLAPPQQPLANPVSGNGNPAAFQQRSQGPGGLASGSMGVGDMSAAQRQQQGGGMQQPPQQQQMDGGGGGSGMAGMGGGDGGSFSSAHQQQQQQPSQGSMHNQGYSQQQQQPSQQQAPSGDQPTAVGAGAGGRQGGVSPQGEGPQARYSSAAQTAAQNGPGSKPLPQQQQQTARSGQHGGYDKAANGRSAVQTQQQPYQGSQGSQQSQVGAQQQQQQPQQGSYGRPGAYGSGVGGGGAGGGASGHQQPTSTQSSQQQYGAASYPGATAAQGQAAQGAPGQSQPRQVSSYSQQQGPQQGPQGAQSGYAQQYGYNQQQPGVQQQPFYAQQQQQPQQQPYYAQQQQQASTAVPQTQIDPQVTPQQQPASVVAPTNAYGAHPAGGPIVGPYAAGAYGQQQPQQSGGDTTATVAASTASQPVPAAAGAADPTARFMNPTASYPGAVAAPVALSNDSHPSSAAYFAAAQQQHAAAAAQQAAYQAAAAAAAAQQQQQQQHAAAVGVASTAVGQPQQPGIFTNMSAGSGPVAAPTNEAYYQQMQQQYVAMQQNYQQAAMAAAGSRTYPARSVYGYGYGMNPTSPPS